MKSDRALNLMNDMLWHCLVVAAPLLIVTICIGVLVGIFQVTTQLQEASLSYVPKLLGAAAVLILLGPWMMERITSFSQSLYLAIPELAA